MKLASLDAGQQAQTHAPHAATGKAADKAKLGLEISHTQSSYSFSASFSDGNNHLKLVLQTSINAPRQKTQAIIKQACQRAGIELELKTIAASVFFSSDVANPDTFTKFYCDLQMYTTGMQLPDPEQFMAQYVSTNIANKDNKWQGRNINRWRNEEYDRAFRAAESELDPVKRAALFIRMNDLIIESRITIPVVFRPFPHGLSNKLVAPMSGWDNDLWLLKDWYREA